MRNTKHKTRLLGAGLLGITTLGITLPTEAQSRADIRKERQDVRQAREKLQEQRRDVRKADTARERREEQAALAKKQQKLQQQQAQLQRAQQRRLQQQRRDVNRDGVYDHKDAYVIGQRREAQSYNGRYDYRRNGVNTRRDFRTQEGTVVNNLGGDAFVLRTVNGQQLRVQVPGGELKRISRGDRVRVYGFFSNGTFRAENLTILRNR
jgi:exonuclease VII large subunit